jgi:hypothetical protein
MISEIQKIKDSQTNYNQAVSIRDKDNIITIFQYITMTGLVIIISLLLSFLYVDVSKSLKFNNPIPLLVTEKSFYTPEVKSIFVKQMFFDLYSARTDYEMGLFNLFNTKALLQESMLVIFNNFIATKRDLLGFEVIEVFHDFGTSFVDKDTGIIKNTKSKYTVVVKEDFLSPGTKVTSDTRYRAYEITFDSFGKIINFIKSKTKNITTKHYFVNFIENISPSSLSSNIDFNSPISSIALSSMDIQKITFHRLEMRTKHTGEPLGIVNLEIDGRKYKAEISIASDGKPSLLISLDD